LSGGAATRCSRKVRRGLRIPPAVRARVRHLQRSIWMVVIYAQTTDPGELEPTELSERLAAVVREAMPWFASLSDADACRPEREGKWSAKQVVGHLTDSAVNNLGRIVRMQLESNQSLPGY